MAPETINSKQVGYYTDMWAVICILFFCYTGHNPFTDKTDYLIFQNISNVDVNDENIDLIPEEALNLIVKFFKEEPSQRIGYNGIKDFDFNKIKSHPFFKLTDESITINQIRQSLMNKSSYFRRNLLKKINKNNNYQNTVELNILNNNLNKNNKNKFEENKNGQNEGILKSGLLKKQSPYYYYDLRKIVLYDTPRIDYIDPNKSLLKGRIILTQNCYAELIKSNQFKLFTPKRTFIFMCKERYNISPWVTAINSAIKIFG
jgi:serine/threonine protein kinase